MNVQGGRMPLQWRNRTATHFERGEDGPTSRGFVSHSFLEGLTPFEMYAHSMSGREGLIDTAIKTAQTGYTERKLMKCLENITTHFDGTVRDGDRIVQFLYGDDGFDGAKVETQHVKPLVGAIQKDLDMLTKSHYHFPVPVHRIVRRMELFGGVQKGCGPPVDIDSDNELLKAFIERAHPQHDPEYEGKVRARDSKVSRKGKDMSRGVCRALAAQSIGERTTQCTLNSVDYKEWLVIRGYPKADCIGRVIDDIMSRYGYKSKNGSHVTRFVECRRSRSTLAAKYPGKKSRT